MRTFKTALFVVALFVLAWVVNILLASIDVNAVNATSLSKPCSTNHTCLKNHTYPTYCTGNIGDSSNGYNVIACTGANSTAKVTPTATAKTTSKKLTGTKIGDEKELTPTVTPVPTKNVQNQATTSNNGSDKDGLQTVLQKLGPYYPSPNTIAAMQDRLKQAKTAMQGSFKTFTVHVVLDVFLDNNGTIHVISACYVQCTTEIVSSDSTSVYAVVTCNKEVIQPLILINSTEDVQVISNVDYVELNELTSRHHLYIMFA